MNAIIRNNKIPLGLLTMLVALLAITGCSKGDSPNNTIPEVPQVPETPIADLYYKVHRISNLSAGSVTENPTDETQPFLYSLRTQKIIANDRSKSIHWDISFGKTLHSFVGGNNGKDSHNISNGSAGKGGILILEKAFDDVVDIPDDNLFRTATDIIGADKLGDFGDGIGWYIYDYSGTIIGDGSKEKEHVAYALPNGLKTVAAGTVSPRTLVLRLANGDYAKIRMLSLYKDLLDPITWVKTSPKSYFTFDYLVVPAGSKKFTIKS
ncbi:hypothetical protein ACL9RF_14055 [Sphingobacterium sp. Mn56C]|uniref:hypothetical protein n=1 Tax=Sphingobacterium sp. Mn56C TaxID=3395261 RepID=UPI003BE70F37